MEQFSEYQMALMEKSISNQVAKDAAMINKYLADNNITAEKDSSGLMYVCIQKGGAKPTVANCVEVNYRGALSGGWSGF